VVGIRPLSSLTSRRRLQHLVASGEFEGGMVVSVRFLAKAILVFQSFSMS
jgi:hypothetical protein